MDLDVKPTKKARLLYAARKAISRPPPTRLVRPINEAAAVSASKAKLVYNGSTLAFFKVLLRRIRDDVDKRERI